MSTCPLLVLGIILGEHVLFTAFLSEVTEQVPMCVLQGLWAGLKGTGGRSLGSAHLIGPSVIFRSRCTSGCDALRTAPWLRGGRFP